MATWGSLRWGTSASSPTEGQTRRERRERRQARGTARLLVGLGGLLLLAAATLTVVQPSAASGATPSFMLHAQFTGLYPNADLTQSASVDNTEQYPLIVNSASATVFDASPTCTAANVVIHPFAGAVKVAAGGTAAIPLRIQMAATAPDACQGASFPLTFIASGARDGAPASGGSTAANGSTSSSASSGIKFAFTGSTVVPLTLFGVLCIVAGVLALRRSRRVAEAQS
jgi:hypothetical protein